MVVMVLEQCHVEEVCTLEEIKGYTIPCLWSKTTLITGGVGRTGRILPLVKSVHFFLGPWLLVFQFIEISNQIEVNGHVLNFEQKKLYNSLLYKKFCFQSLKPCKLVLFDWTFL